MLDRTLLTFFVNALWQAPLVGAAVALACRLMRNAPARHTHAVCVAGLAAALLLPIAAVRRSTPEPRTIAISQQFDIAPAAPTLAPAAAPNPASRGVEIPRPAVSIAAWALAALLLVRLTMLAIAALKTLRICRTARPAADCHAFDRARAAFGLDRVELRWSDTVSGPVTAGRLVILPANMASASDEVLATAIGHEMAHIARHDFAWNLLYELLALPISFQPAAYWLRRQIDRTRELACDELVTAQLLDSRVYAQSIMEIASTMSGLPRPGYSLGVFDGNNLEERIQRLVRRPAAYTRRARVLLGAGIATRAVCVIVASTLAISARAQGPAQQEMRAAGDAYNSGAFELAVQHFEKAVVIEPDSVKARLFLADAYLRLDSRAGREHAREQALEILRREPGNHVGALILVNANGSQHSAESREFLLKAIGADPKSKEAYYTLGFVDWVIAYPRLTKANPNNGVHLYDRIEDPQLRANLRRELLPYIEEGLRVLQIAHEMDPNWSDPMAYLNLMSRLRAPLADDAAESARYIAQADDWVAKAIAARKAHRALPQDMDHIDVDGPVPAFVPMIPPPPPPPPPPGGFRGNGDKK
jgi:beta-lactamase regulating signal transducer with metallopeptidase domain